MLSYAGYVFLHNSVPSPLAEQALAAAAATTSKTARAQAILYVVLTSSDYQIIQ
jgi:hypothetical protein